MMIRQKNLDKLLLEWHVHSRSTAIYISARRSPGGTVAVYHHQVLFETFLPVSLTDFFSPDFLDSQIIKEQV
jgi:hypothetical protein